jgi:hypothetical protein|tara:strand:+ start:560 stop:706 length:147 start_codon:yes stop_codon:yes gene_type:complete
VLHGGEDCGFTLFTADGLVNENEEPYPNENEDETVLYRTPTKGLSRAQ